jgi:hypothetical protein
MSVQPVLLYVSLGTFNNMFKNVALDEDYKNRFVRIVNTVFVNGRFMYQVYVGDIVA